jgi:hypothetical protein
MSPDGATRMPATAGPHLEEILRHVADRDGASLSAVTVGSHTRAIFARLGLDERIHAVSVRPGPG